MIHLAVQLAIFSVLLLNAVKAQSSNHTLPVRIDPVIIPGAPFVPRVCPSADILESARTNLSEAILQSLPTSEPPTLSPCGGASWRPVADLNMADPSQNCPSPWAETLVQARSCISSSVVGCEGVNFTVSGGSYSRVCGRIVGYVLAGGPDAFKDLRGLGNGNIDNPYLDGVSVTVGSPRQHVWSFGVGCAQQYGYCCPCDNPSNPLPPSFVGDNYFCDSAHNGALWDGEDCTTPCCTFNSPPYFTTTLPAPTSEDIEVRNCIDRSGERVSIGVLQLFVQ